MQSLLRYIAIAIVTFSTVASLAAVAPPANIDISRVKVLLHNLDAESFRTRQQADESLRALGKPVLPLLREERGRTASLEVRFRLDRIVHDLTLDERIPDLVQMLGHEDTQFRDRAEYALRQAGAAVVPLLQQQLKPALDVKRRKKIEKIIAELSIEGR